MPPCLVSTVDCPFGWYLYLALALCVDHLVGSGDPIFAAVFSSDHCWGLGWFWPFFFLHNVNFIYVWGWYVSAICTSILENATQFWKCGFALKSTLFEGAQIKLAPHFFLPFSNVCGMRFLQRNWPKWAKYVRGSCSKKTLPTFTQSQHHSNRETGTALHYHVYPLHWVATRIV